MNQKVRYHLIFLMILLLGSLFYRVLYNVDNKYTAALASGYGYNILQDDPDQVGFLVDGWEYYPGQLLSPADFDAGIEPESYTYIGQYANFSEHSGSPYGTATYRLRLDNPGTTREWALYLPELLCAGRVYIGGQLVGEHGSLNPYVPRVIDGVYAFAVDGNTDIIIQCANYTHYYSGLYYPPAVGSIGAISRMMAVRLIVYGFLCFSSLAVALSYLAQWVLGRSQLTHRLGLLCLAFALRVCYPFVRALGAPLVAPLYALEDVCGNLVLLCAILLAEALSQTTPTHCHKRCAVPAALCLCAVSVIFPLFILPHAPIFINIYGRLLFLCRLAAGIYLFYLSVCILRCAGTSGIFLLGASAFYAQSLIVSALSTSWFEPICGAWPEEYGGFLLVCCFATLMVRRGIRLTQDNQRLTFHLQEEVDHKTRWMETLLSERRELLANLLHDVKNPLAALRSYVDLVRTGGIALDEETAGYLDALTERANALEQRFDLLQDFSRGERGIFHEQDICLNDFLRDFYLRNQPDMELFGLEFDLELPQAHLTIRGDRNRLRMALENLCYNALSFTPPDGTIRLRLQQLERCAEIIIEDTGVGIAPEDLPHIFERGFTKRPDDSGDGLGLYIVRTIVLEHSGTVRALSEPGGGSVFIISLPLAGQDCVQDKGTGLSDKKG